jgi:hypothetical protein
LRLLLPFAINEPGLWHYSLQNAAGEAGMKAYIQAAIEDRERGLSFPFIVLIKNDRNTQEVRGTMI